MDRDCESLIYRNPPSPACHRKTSKWKFQRHAPISPIEHRPFNSPRQVPTIRCVSRMLFLDHIPRAYTTWRKVQLLLRVFEKSSRYYCRDCGGHVPDMITWSTSNPVGQTSFPYLSAPMIDLSTFWEFCLNDTESHIWTSTAGHRNSSQLNLCWNKHHNLSESILNIISKSRFRKFFSSEILYIAGLSASSPSNGNNFISAAGHIYQFSQSATRGTSLPSTGAELSTSWTK